MAGSWRPIRLKTGCIFSDSHQGKIKKCDDVSSVTQHATTWRFSWRTKSRRSGIFVLLNVLKANLHSSIVCWKRRNANLAERKNVNLLYEIESLKIFEIFQRISIYFILFVYWTFLNHFINSNLKISTDNKQVYSPSFYSILNLI